MMAFLGFAKWELGLGLAFRNILDQVARRGKDCLVAITARNSDDCKGLQIFFSAMMVSLITPLITETIIRHLL